MDQKLIAEVYALVDGRKFSEAFGLVKKYYVPLVGRLVISFGEFEHEVGESLTFFLDIDSKAGAVTLAQITSIKAKLALLETLIKHRDKSLADEARQIYNAAKRANKIRNNAVHGPWHHLQSGPNEFYMQKSRHNRNNHKLEFVNIYPHEIEEAIQICSDLKTRIEKLRFAVARARHAAKNGPKH